MRFIQYSHHGAMVWVNPELQGMHRDHCLCWQCANFHPGTDENCSIAQKLYKLCVQEDLVTPVYECPKFVELKEQK